MFAHQPINMHQSLPKRRMVIGEFLFFDSLSFYYFLDPGRLRKLPVSGLVVHYDLSFLKKKKKKKKFLLQVKFINYHNLTTCTVTICIETSTITNTQNDGLGGGGLKSQEGG